jgi:hypothetical protein
MGIDRRNSREAKRGPACVGRFARASCRDSLHDEMQLPGEISHEYQLNRD